MSEQLAIPLPGETVTVDGTHGPYEARMVKSVPADEWVEVPEHPARIRIPPESIERALVHDEERHVWAAVPVENIR